MRISTYFKSFLSALLFLASNSAFAQTQRCGTMQYTQQLMLDNPDYAHSIQNNEQIIADWIANHPNLNSDFTGDTIPVVVHVLWKTSSQNISDAQVLSQIDVLNEDFSRTNADTVNTPTPWQTVAGTLPYRFHLARRDANGNPTNGIVRVQTTVTSFSTNNNIKHTSTGGSDAWPVNDYLNVWVGNLGGGILGYGEFPANPHTTTFGFVCHYRAFGRVGNLMAPYNLGRTTTHEISHCFNLRHIWGDDGGACSGSDYVSDTPNQGDATFGCYNFPHVDNCTSTGNGIMYMNYMDYSDDDCLNMFTNNQSLRFQAALNAFYPTLLTSNGLDFVTDISASELRNGINVFPNPSNGIVYINNVNVESKSVTLTVTNVLGKIIIRQELVLQNQQPFNLDLTENEMGVYFVQLSSDKSVTSSRVVINR